MDLRSEVLSNTEEAHEIDIATDSSALRPPWQAGFRFNPCKFSQFRLTLLQNTKLATPKLDGNHHQPGK
jgi:hypothetical protein